MATEKADEALFVNEKGYITEGTISNLFVEKRGILYTPKDDVLPGTTKQLVEKIARQLKIKVIKKNFTKRFLKNADGIFITSSIMGIKPVVKCNKWLFKVGSIYKSLANQLG